MPDYDAEINELQSRMDNLRAARERDAEIDRQREAQVELENSQEAYIQRERREFVGGYAAEWNARPHDPYGQKLGLDPTATNRYAIERMKEAMGPRLAASAEMQYGLGSPMAAFFRRWSTGA